MLADTLIPLLAAAGLGGILGWERESWKKPAGLRTYMMVSLGAAAFTLVSFGALSAEEFSGVQGGDPTRIIEGVATGIGFLGAGSIIQARGRVHGITTAAGIWVVGAVGACCGAGRFDIAVTLVVLAVIILALLPKLETAIGGPKEQGADNEPES